MVITMTVWTWSPSELVELVQAVVVVGSLGTFNHLSALLTMLAVLSEDTLVIVIIFTSLFGGCTVVQAHACNLENE